MCPRFITALRCLATGFVFLAGATVAFPEDGVGQQIGQKIDQGVNQLGSVLKQSWQDIKQSANQMGVEARVYTRLHWDKILQDATIDIDVQNGGVVFLKGSVSSATAKAEAVRLTQGTVGVEQVVDELAIAPPPTNR